MVTLAVQATGVAIIATGMVLVIVSRNIDLSVGSLVGFIAMTYALLMTDWLPNILGIGPDFPVPLGSSPWPSGSSSAPASARSRASSSPTSACRRSSSRWAGCCRSGELVWYLSSGAAVSGLDPNFQLVGGGAQGSVGGPLTWIIGVVGCIAIIALLINSRRQRRRYRIPGPAHVGGGADRRASAACWCSAWPPSPTPTSGRRVSPNAYAAEQNIGPTPAGGWRIPTGFPFPIVLLIGVTLVMTLLATRRRFGRYVYAYGGNPDAAELAGINTRWTILKTYVLMGVLCALAAADRGSPAQRSDARRRPELRAVRHRRGRRRRHVVRGRHRDHPGRRPRRVRPAVARLRAELHGRQLARPERRRRDRADPGGRLRHLQPPAQLVSGRRIRPVTVASGTPLVEMRDINVAFGGVHAVRDVTIDLHAGRGHRPRRRQRRRQVDPDARRCRAPIRPTAARSGSTASRSPSATRATPRR